MAQLKTQATQVGVADLIAAVAHPVRRADAARLVTAMEGISGAPATMWGPSIIGFGRYRYRYDSGHAGEMCRIGFSPRKASLVLYLARFDGMDALLARLGKHRSGVGCLYVATLADIDMAILETMIVGA